MVGASGYHRRLLEGRLYLSGALRYGPPSGPVHRETGKDNGSDVRFREC